MSPRTRKAMLTVHVAVSVGWLGAIAAYVALNVPALASDEDQTVRAAYLMMEPVLIYAVLPLGLLSLVTGVVQAAGTPWGLFRHYWVTISLAVTTFAASVMVLHVSAVRHLSTTAADPGSSVDELGGDLFHSVGGLLALVVPLVLNIYKPRGLTRHGRRLQREERQAGARPS